MEADDEPMSSAGPRGTPIGVDRLSDELIGVTTADVAAHSTLPQRPCTIEAFVPTHAGARKDRQTPIPVFTAAWPPENREIPRIRSDAFSPIMIVGAFVFAPTSVGMIDASTTRRPSVPRTRN